MAKKIKFFCSLQKKESRKQGRWSPEEQERFLKGCYFFKNDWEKIKDYIKTRSIPQIRSHAQKYLIKICRKYSIKLSKKKFSNKLSKHLDITKIPYKGKTNISNMSIYEKNILDMFNYYNREIMNDDLCCGSFRGRYKDTDLRHNGCGLLYCSRTPSEQQILRTRQKP